MKKYDDWSFLNGFFVNERGVKVSEKFRKISEKVSHEPKNKNKKTSRQFFHTCHDAQQCQISFSNSQKPNSKSAKMSILGCRWNHLVSRSPPSNTRQMASVAGTYRTLYYISTPVAGKNKCSRAYMLITWYNFIFIFFQDDIITDAMQQQYTGYAGCVCVCSSH
ncbi:MAG: hypothetical protein ABJP52_09510 [Flavobacteriaceae bacterium]